MSTNVVTLIVGTVTALVALAGYMLTQATTRKDAETQFYARAMEAVKELEEMPYRIARRSSADSSTRSLIGNQLSDAYIKVEFFRHWLKIHSPLTGEVYTILLRRNHKILRGQIREAWETPPLANDSENHLNAKFDIDNSLEWELLTLVARRELSLLSLVLRRGTRRATRAFQRDHPDR